MKNNAIGKVHPSETVLPA